MSNHYEKETERLKEGLIVLYHLINKREINNITMDLLNDAIHDLIFGHGINSFYYLKEDDYIETFDEVLELTGYNIKEEWMES